MPELRTGIPRRYRRPGATRWRPGCPRTGSSVSQSPGQCGYQASRVSSAPMVSCARLSGPVERTKPHTIAFQLDLKLIERPRRRAGDDFPVNGEVRSVARADKLTPRFLPMIYTAEMRASRVECGDLR